MASGGRLQPRARTPDAGRRGRAPKRARRRGESTARPRETSDAREIDRACASSGGNRVRARGEEERRRRTDLDLRWAATLLVSAGRPPLPRSRPASPLGCSSAPVHRPSAPAAEAAVHRTSLLATASASVRTSVDSASVCPVRSLQSAGRPQSAAASPLGRPPLPWSLSGPSAWPSAPASPLDCASVGLFRLVCPPPPLCSLLVCSACLLSALLLPRLHSCSSAVCSEV